MMHDEAVAHLSPRHRAMTPEILGEKRQVGAERHRGDDPAVAAGRAMQRQAFDPQTKPRHGAARIGPREEQDLGRWPCPG